MNLKPLTWKMLLLPVLLVLIASITACHGAESMEPRAWIDAPPDGVEVPLGTPVSIISHGYARQGVAELLLSVNGQPYRRDVPIEAGIFSEVRQEWVPSEAGLYTLQVITYDNTGAASSPASITLRVGQVVAEKPSPTSTLAKPTDTPTGKPPITDTPTATATSMPSPTWTPTHEPTLTDMPTDTPTPTHEPTPTDMPTGTATPTHEPTPTSTNTPSPTSTTPPDIRLWADAEQLQAGSCTTVRWHVSEVTAYWVDGKAGAGDDGSFQTCPCLDETHTLRAQTRDGQELNLSVTIHVSGQCGDPPPAPSPAVPANGLALECRAEQNLVWMPVTHPDAVQYYVKIEQQVDGIWQKPQGWGPITGKQVTVQVECGNIYRWTVRAEDSMGYQSDWAVWSEFTIEEGLY